MFTALHFKDRLNQDPFKPFRIHLSDGAQYDITIHDVAMIKRHALEVGIDPDQDSIVGPTVERALIHITRVEELTQAGVA